MANSELSIKLMRSGKEEEGKKTLAAAAVAVFLARATRCSLNNRRKWTIFWLGREGGASAGAT